MLLEADLLGCLIFMKINQHYIVHVHLLAHVHICLLLSKKHLWDASRQNMQEQLRGTHEAALSRDNADLA